MKKRIITLTLTTLIITSIAGAPVFAARHKTRDTINQGYTYTFDKYDNIDNENTEDTYVLNTKTKKVHHPDCSSVKKIAKKNYETSSKSTTELKKDGYTLCGKCFK